MRVGGLLHTEQRLQLLRCSATRSCPAWEAERGRRNALERGGADPDARPLERWQRVVCNQTPSSLAPLLDPHPQPKAHAASFRRLRKRDFGRGRPERKRKPRPTPSLLLRSVARSAFQEGRCPTTRKLRPFS